MGVRRAIKALQRKMLLVVSRIHSGRHCVGGYRAVRSSSFEDDLTSSSPFLYARVRIEIGPLTQIINQWGTQADLKALRPKV